MINDIEAKARALEVALTTTGAELIRQGEELLATRLELERVRDELEKARKTFRQKLQNAEARAAFEKLAADYLRARLEDLKKGAP